MNDSRTVDLALALPEKEISINAVAFHTSSWEDVILVLTDLTVLAQSLTRFVSIAPLISSQMADGVLDCNLMLKLVVGQLALDSFRISRS